MTTVCIPLRHILRPREVVGKQHLPILSVYRDYGVVHKDSRSDNFNKTPLDLSRYQEVRPGDLVVNKMKAWQGSLAVSQYHGIVSPDYLVCSLSPAVHPQYLHYLLRSSPLIFEYERRSKGIRPAQWRLYWDDLAAVLVTIPKVDEQHRIADFLNGEVAGIDELIIKKLQMIKLLDERLDAHILRAVEIGLNPDVPLKAVRSEWIGEIPLHWSLPPVSAHFEVQLGKMLTAEASAGTEQFPYLRNLNVQWDRIDLDDLATMSFNEADRIRYRLEPGDLLVCEGGEVGRAAVWKGHTDEIFFQKAIHRVRPHRDGNTRFLMYCLRAAAKQNVFAVEGNQSTIVHLTAEKLRVHRFPFPPLEEQHSIVEYLDHRRDEKSSVRSLLERQIPLLQERRQALITAAVTGQLNTPGAAA